MFQIVLCECVKGRDQMVMPVPSKFVQQRGNKGVK